MASWYNSGTAKGDHPRRCAVVLVVARSLGRDAAISKKCKPLICFIPPVGLPAECEALWLKLCLHVPYVYPLTEPMLKTFRLLPNTSQLKREISFVDTWLTSHVSDHSALNHRKNVVSALAAVSSGEYDMAEWLVLKVGEGSC